jgi:hypothetical protein
VAGLIAMLWFTLGLALLLRPYDGELPWRSCVAFVPSIVVWFAVVCALLFWGRLDPWLVGS